MMLQKFFLKYLAAWPSETQGHRAIRYKSVHAQIHRASGFSLLSLAGASMQTPEP
jgi:hypothetical protein